MKSLLDRYRTAEEKEIYIENLFSKIENYYDKMNRIMSFGLDMSWRRRAMRLAHYEKDSLLLDVATGTGDLSLSALQVTPEINIICLDFCFPLLSKAKEKFDQHNGHQPAGLIAANALLTPLKNETFDGVITAFSLRNVTDVEKLFIEFFRLAKKGAKVVTLEMMKPDNPFLKLIFLIYFKRIIPLIGRLLSQYSDPYSYLPLSIENFYTAEQIVQLMTKCGWQNVFYKKILFGFMAVHIGEKQISM